MVKNVGAGHPISWVETVFHNHFSYQNSFVFTKSLLQEQDVWEKTPVYPTECLFSNRTQKTENKS